MSRKSKYTSEQKVKACGEYLSGAKSASQIAKELKMTKSGKREIIEWSKKYHEIGAEAFIPTNKNSSYTKEFKLRVIQEYNSGLGSIESLANKYRIRSKSTLIEWISKYNRHEELQDYIPTLEVYTMKARKTTKEERIEIVKWCLDHNDDYKKTANTYNCSYTQVYQWVNKYKMDGEDGLIDRRGQCKAEEILSDEERLKKDNDRLNRRNKELEREIELLKKLNAFEWEK